MSNTYFIHQHKSLFVHQQPYFNKMYISSSLYDHHQFKHEAASRMTRYYYDSTTGSLKTMINVMILALSLFSLVF
jgi:hypothetical protein